MQSSGTISTEESTRGETRYCTGLTPIVTSASICSVTRMLPSSAAIALPARAVTISAVKTGLISRVSEMATTDPTTPCAPNVRRLCTVCRASTMPLNTPVSETMKIDCTPMKSIAAKS